MPFFSSEPSCETSPWERADDVGGCAGLPFTNSHNTRFAKLTFHIPHASVLHGFAGYFEAVLYGSVGLSIHPRRMDKISKDMLSWFPLFFPLKVWEKPPFGTSMRQAKKFVVSKEPLYLPSNCELHVSIWRLTNERHVWYEWHAEAFLPLPQLAMALVGERSQAQGTPSKRYSSLSGTPSLAPSSLADADDLGSLVASPSRIVFEVAGDEQIESDARFGLIKVGQTALHNPKGRSSWIGL